MLSAACWMMQAWRISSMRTIEQRSSAASAAAPEVEIVG
jgi:hypothetical protein